ncbi:MAG TPA: non-homologous end-joining DNA ligase [Candidatus Thermoplasmatota archaeon]|nr:non-homologous end-joining DNA ligase [Candidatus Thermoplasmatota archaeon]
MAAAGESVTVDVAGRELKLTSLDRVVYPKVGFTKRDVIAYYSEVARVMLPHLKDRAVEVRRYPDGVARPGFWQRDLPPPEQRPPWVQAARVYAQTRKGEIEYPHVVDEPTLLWCANRNMLEFHVFLAPFERPTNARTLVFDLDPGRGRDVVDCADIALVLRDTLEGEGLRVFPKTSGGKGLQLYVPLNCGGVTFAQTKAFARELAEAFEHLRPELVTARVAKSERAGKVLIDWGQNERNHLMVCPYSLRARDEPTVSAPVTWDEVERLAEERDAALLRFTAWEALERVEEKGDLFAEVLTLKQKLPF